MILLFRLFINTRDCTSKPTGTTRAVLLVTDHEPNTARKWFQPKKPTAASLLSWDNWWVGSSKISPIFPRSNRVHSCHSHSTAMMAMCLYKSTDSICTRSGVGRLDEKSSKGLLIAEMKRRKFYLVNNFSFYVLPRPWKMAQKRARKVHQRRLWARYERSERKNEKRERILLKLTTFTEERLSKVAETF